MEKFQVARKIVVWSAGCASSWVCLQLILFFGVEKKSFLQIFADILGGGAAGAGLGILFFLVFGAIGWVSGAIYGALGLFSLMLGGALGGLGIGSLIHIARNPDHYNFNFPIILVGSFVSFLLIRWVSSKVGRLYDTHGPSLAKWFMAKLDGKNA
ncbi:MULTISPECIES: hypothetical protein [unclassified Methylophaga]|uniref:hypothetical protein n=1 Tax=unclassified Methylophaga TaxID=2629249 RepID=UPI00259CC3C7|nr:MULTISPECIES: hypothetical protein [unclassified Methylophaga]